MSTWVRWKRSKWHAARQGTLFTRCGHLIVEVNREPIFHEGESEPVDDHANCLHCLRSLEMAARKEAEQNAEFERLMMALERG